MRKSTCHTSIICLSIALAALGLDSYAKEPEPVDQFGDLSCMIIQGLDSFDVDQAKRAMNDDVQVVLAAHPRAPLAGLAPVLQQRLLAGLLAAGACGGRGGSHCQPRQNVHAGRGSRRARLRM